MYNKDTILNSIDNLIRYFQIAVKTQNVDKTGDPHARDYVSFDLYVKDLRSRITILMKYFNTEIILENKREVKDLELRCSIIQAEKQLYYQDKALKEEGYSKSQSETIGRKRAEMDGDYKAIREAYNEAKTLEEYYRNLFKIMEHTLYAIAQYSKESFEH